MAPSPCAVALRLASVHTSAMCFNKVCRLSVLNTPVAMICLCRSSRSCLAALTIRHYGLRCSSLISFLAHLRANLTGQPIKARLHFSNMQHQSLGGYRMSRAERAIQCGARGLVSSCSSAEALLHLIPWRLTPAINTLASSRSCCLILWRAG